MNLALTPAVESSVTIPPEHIAARDAALTQARLLIAVKNPTAQAKAVEIGRKLREIQTSTEAARKAVKAPVLVLERAIDDAATAFIDPVSAEIKRLIGLVNSYQAEETKKLREAEAAAERARAEQAKMDQQKLRLESASPHAVPQPRETMALPKPVPKPEGMRSAPVWTFEITDLGAFEAADMQRPVGGRLGTFEVSKSAMAAAIRQGLREFPGVRIFETQSTSFTGR